jgi:hypothetical protein
MILIDGKYCKINSKVISAAKKYSQLKVIVQYRQQPVTVRSADVMCNMANYVRNMPLNLFSKLSPIEFFVSYHFFKTVSFKSTGIGQLCSAICIYRPGKGNQPANPAIKHGPERATLAAIRPNLLYS